MVSLHAHASFSDGTSTFEQNVEVPLPALDGDRQTFSL